MTSLTRRYHFSASHRLDSPELTAEENARLYGKCNNPFGHGHNYALEVTVSGEIDPETGCILPVGRLDRLVEQKILRVFAHRNINVDVPEFARLIPTTENMARAIAETLQRNWDDEVAPSGARLARVHIKETERNRFEVVL
jgi:6-pyruvoyltetrahydropterin/6-carboxytetrahydropterin synthase